MIMNQTLDISWSTIAKIFLAGFILYVLFLVRDIVVWFFFALMISILVEPLIKVLRKLFIPKIVAVILVYLAIFGVIGLLIYLAAPIFIFELNQLAKAIPNYFERINPLLKTFGVDVAQNFEDFVSSLILGLKESSKSIITAITIFFGGIASTILIFIFAFYISIEDKGTERVIALLTPKKYEGFAVKLFETAQYKVAGWFGARLLACLFVGVASFVIFFIFNVKYAFILALISGVLTFVPFIGPLATAILVLLFVGMSNSWLLATYMIVALTVLQQIENSVVTPLLMKKFLNLPPILVLISLLVGGIIFGVLGMIFMVPVCGIIYEFTKEFLEKNSEQGVIEQ